MELIIVYEPILTIIISIVAIVIPIYITKSARKQRERASMEGSILEYEKYNNPFFDDIGKYSNAKSFSDLYDTLHIEVLGRFNDATAIGFSDSLQKVVDSLLWIAWLKNFDTQNRDGSDTDFETLTTDIYHTVAKGFEKFKKQDIHGKWDKTIESNVNLIYAVLSYLDASEGLSEKRNAIEKVNGGMLINRIARFIFHDYKGLTYMNSAKRKLCLQLKVPKEPSWEDIAKYKRLRKNTNIEYIKALLDKAKSEFEDAESIAKKDVFLQSFVFLIKQDVDC